MPRTPATVTQADVARILRAAKQAGATTVEIPLPDGQVVIVHLDKQDEKNKHFTSDGEIVL
jgi:hypothetical protein